MFQYATSWYIEGPRRVHFLINLSLSRCVSTNLPMDLGYLYKEINHSVFVQLPVLFKKCMLKIGQNEK